MSDPRAIVTGRPGTVEIDLLDGPRPVALGGTGGFPPDDPAIHATGVKVLVQHLALVQPVGDAVGADKGRLAVIAEVDVEVVALQSGCVCEG